MIGGRPILHLIIDVFEASVQLAQLFRGDSNQTRAVARDAVKRRLMAKRRSLGECPSLQRANVLPPKVNWR